MASIDIAGRNELIALYEGMFKAAPGATNLSEMVTLKESGKSLLDIAVVFSAKAGFSTVYPAFLTATEFAARLVANLLGSEVAYGAGSAGEWSTNWVIGQLQSGKSAAQVITIAVQALRSTTNTEFANAQAALTNKVDVGSYYSVTKEQSSTDLATLQSVISGVTSTASTVTTAKTTIDTGYQISIGKTYTLTTGIDTITAGAGNDTIIGNNTATPADTLTSLDNIDGGDGNDTFSITSTAAVALPTTASVKNVETVVITSAKEINGDVSGWTGLTSLTAVSATAATTNQALTVGASDVALTTVYTDDGAGAASTTGTIGVTGGKAVTINSTIAGELGVGFDTTQGVITVTGTANTTSVSVTQTAPATGSATVKGVVNGTVNITDVNSASTTAAGKITTVSLTNFGAATVNTGALATVNLSGKGTSFNAGTSGALTTATATTVALNVNGLTTTGAVTFDADVKTLNVASATAASTINSLSATGATAVNISGDSKLTLTGDTFAATAVITSTNTSGVTVGTALGATQTFAGGSGADTITVVAANTKAITTGAGNDTVTYQGALGTGGSIDAGDGTDTIKMSDTVAATATATATFAGTVSNFEVLEINVATTAATAINMANADGMNSLVTNGVAAGNALTVTNAAANFTFTQKAVMAAASSIALATDTGTSDNVNLVFSAADGFTNTAALTVANVETLTITTSDTSTLAANTTIVTAPITAAAATSVTLAGGLGVSLLGGMTQTVLTSLDASGLTGTATVDGLTWTAGALASAATVKGSAAGTNTIILSAATKAVTYTGGTGIDAVTVANAQDNVITLGNGANVFTGTGSTGINTITAGTGNDTIILGTGASKVDVGSGTDAVTIGLPVNANSYATITGLGGTGDTLVMAHLGAEVFTAAKITLADTAAFRDFLDASAAGDGHTNAIIKWFQYGGDTYVTEDVSAANSFSDGLDYIVKLTGLVDLSTATTGSTNTITFA